MRLVLSVIFSAIVTSCGIPISYNLTSNELKGLSCLETDETYYLSRSVDTCPLLSLKPAPRSDVWELKRYDQLGQRYVDESKKYIRKLEVRSCELPTLVSENIVIQAGAKFHLKDAYTKSDTMAANRLFLNGTLQSGDGEIKWRSEVGMNEQSSIRKRILSQFKSCGNGS